MAWHHSPNIQTLKLFGMLTAAFLASFYLIESVLLPVLISLALYTLLEPATQYLVRHNVNRSLAITIVLFFLMIASLLALGFAVPVLLEQAGNLQSKLPQTIQLVERLSNEYLEKLSGPFSIDTDVSDIFKGLLAQTITLGQSALIDVSNGLISFVIIGILVPFLTYYLLRDFRQARNNLMNWLPNSSFELGWLIYHNVSRQLNAYTRGVMIQSAIMATICSIGFLLIGLDNPFLFGAITGVLNLAPYVGPIISMVLATLVGATMSPFDPQVIYFAISTILFAQLVDNFVVVPHAIGSVANLHPVQVILGIIVFGSLFGMLGVILAIPAIAAGKIVYNNLYADIRNASQRLPV